MDPRTAPPSPDLAEHNDSFTPGTLGERVADKLLAKIRSDGLAPGTRLPSEHAMAVHFGVSRTVVRAAIALLKVDGVLTTRKGVRLHPRRAARGDGRSAYRAVGAVSVEPH